MKSGLIAINLAAIIFGTAALYGKLDVSPFWIVALRGAFASVVILFFGLLKGAFKTRPSNQHIAQLCGTGILLAIHWLTFFYSVQLSGVAIATLTFAAFPLFTVFIEAINAQRTPKTLELIAAAAIIAAVALLMDFKGSNSVIGVIAGIVSAATFAYFGIKSKSLTAQLNSLTVSLSQNIVVAIGLLPFLPFSSPVPSAWNQWACLILLGVVTTALMHQLYLFALKRLSATTCSGFIALEPVYAIVFAAIFFSEPITVWVMISGILIMGSSFALLRSESKDDFADKNAL